MNAALTDIQTLTHYFSDLDIQMVDLVERMTASTDFPLQLAVAFASQALDQGNVCADLNALAGQSWLALLDRDDAALRAACEALPPTPALDEWLAALTTPAARLVIGDAASSTLFVCRGTNVYLRRYWTYERSVEAALLRLHQPLPRDVAREPLLERYFKTASPLQRVAARAAATQQLTMLSGGPGTGKTYTLARIVAMLAETRKDSFNVAIATPTGKAAARAVESIQKAKHELRKEGVSDAILQAIPETATTIQRLLGPQYHSAYFKHTAEHPLEVDLVVIDETSMVDLPLMAKLLEALPPTCRLLLVGDSEQLASVAPGRIYGDLCAAAQPTGPLAGTLTQLTESRRFPPDSAIGQLSAALQNEPASAWRVVQKVRNQNLCLHDATTFDRDAAFTALVRSAFDAFLRSSDPAEALHASEIFRVLCALRKGPFGVEQVNARIETLLTGHHGFAPQGRFYDHQLILITANTPSLNLTNGDIGVVLRTTDNALHAWFKASDTVRSVPVNLLPPFETAFAMTIHKAQGSEFPTIAMILPPDGHSPLLTRELLYTGITRTAISNDQGALHLWCTQVSFETAAQRKTERTTGLFA